MVPLSCIYLAFCVITEKYYVGFTTNFEERLKNHRKFKSAQQSKKFYNAIKKYGWDNFIWTIIYESWDKNHCLDVMEPHFIQYYNSFYNGYNSTLGGTSPMKNRNHTEENKKKISKKGVNHPMYGKHHTPETKKLMSAKRKGYKVTEEARKNMSLCRLGAKHHMFGKTASVATKLKLVDSHTKNYVLLSPDNEVVFVRNLKLFCETQGLNQGHMTGLFHGRGKSHKGWKAMTSPNLQTLFESDLDILSK